MNKEIIKWLTEDTSWMRFAVETQLLDTKSEPSNAIGDSNISAIIKRLKDDEVGLPGLRTGKLAYTSTGNAFWDLFFLADIGLSISDICMEKEVEAFFDLQLEDGTFVLQNGTKSRHYCIPAIILSSLAKMGYKDDPRIMKFIDTILDSQRLDGGWHCALNRGKGKKLQDTESCPMDNLNLLMLLGRYDAFRTDATMNGAIDLLLAHWRRRMEPWRPYGFGIGDQFLKLRYPAVKYGILRVLDALSLFPYAVESQEFQDMLNHVLRRSNEGRYYAESISRSYSAFDFGQNREPSRWITFIMSRVQKRAGLV